MITLAELCAAWKVTDRKVYRAVERGDLQPAARPGHQPYYLLSNVVELWGEPPNLEALKVIAVDFGGSVNSGKATYPGAAEFTIGA